MTGTGTSFDIVRGQLPSDIGVLESEARAEGLRFIDTLVREWRDGTNRYDSADEVLMTVRQDRELAGIGGVTVDPTALRMRRFYVRTAYRRRGYGRRLASALVARATATSKTIFVNAGTELAPAFWESIGFRRHFEAGHTHVLGNNARSIDMNQN